jgi:hypothetical protein
MAKKITAPIENSGTSDFNSSLTGELGLSSTNWKLESVNVLLAPYIRQHTGPESFRPFIEFHIQDPRNAGSAAGLPMRSPTQSTWTYHRCHVRCWGSTAFLSLSQAEDGLPYVAVLI